MLAKAARRRRILRVGAEGRTAEHTNDGLVIFHGLTEGCGGASIFLNRFAENDHAKKRIIQVPRTVIIIGLVALAALLAGFLMFGGANMGH